jgi:streptomycin 6-kinase
LARDFAADAATDGTLVHTDLHYDNVLMSEGGEWLAIDPKPLSGDRHYELAPMLWNRFEELAGDVRAGVRRRFHTLVDVAGLDEERARDWVVVRMMSNAMEGLSDRDAGYPADWATTCIAVAKAVQD